MSGFSRVVVFATTCWMGVALQQSDRGHAAAAIEPSPQILAAAPSKAFLDTYCIRCHNDRLRTAGLSLDRADLSIVQSQADTWEKVLGKLHAGAMPPPGSPRPDTSQTAVFVSWLETSLDRAAANHPNPGRTDALHRLNRAEYQNAIRDVLGLEVDSSVLLPADDADVNGFDNSGGLLSVSPALIQRYMAAARKISRLAIGLHPSAAATETYAVPDLTQQDRQFSEDLPFGTRGGLAVRHQFPADGDYAIKIRLRRRIYDYITGLDHREQLDVRVDGERVTSFIVGGEDHGRPAPQSFAGDILGSPEWESYVLNADAGLEVRVPVKAGMRVVGVSFISQFFEPEGVLQPRQRYGDYSRDESRGQRVETITISGPYGSPVCVSETASRANILVCRPARAVHEEPCARTILARLATRAYRRPVTDAEIRTLLGFYRIGRREEGFDDGVRLGVERILTDPNFLFRLEREPAKVPANSVYAVSDLELASRLSFFLWSSVPDEELLDLARRGHLRDPAMLDRQVHRMLADVRAKALVDNFAGQWLVLRNVRIVRPDPDLFPDFDEELRDALYRETELFVGSQLRDDRSVVELLSADYTFVNERLARHYGIPDGFGNAFRRVTLAAEPRAGLLGQGSVLLVTSYPNRTSPVLRGKWVLDSILGTPPSPPPPNVPSLKDRGENGRPASVRQRFEEHRTNAGCASCHAAMDPLGFALENFDAIGKWRTRGEAGTLIDASAVLPSGKMVDGPVGLRSALLARREQFVNALTEKLLSYALGRGLAYYDRPTVRKIVRDSSSDGYRWASIITGIVKSMPFLMRSSATRGS